jgi:hypothetical protein
MCGIAGAFSTYLSNHEIGIFEGLMKLSLIRGEEGAGVITATKGKNPKLNILRTKGSSLDLMGTKEWAALGTTDKAVMIGHARWPTKGAADDIAMVHPHHAGHIVGVHNGTVTSVDGEWVKAGESDSKLVFEKIAALGIEGAIKKLRGAYALVWIDEREKTINFLRNHERPLSFGYYGKKNEPPTTVFFASDHRFMDIIMRHKQTDNLIFEDLPVDTLYKFPLRTTGPIQPLEVKKLAPDPFTTTTTHTSNVVYVGRGTNIGGSTRDRVWNYRNQKSGSVSSVDDLFRDAPASAAQRTDDHHETARGFFITSSALETHLKNGCAFCGAQPSMEDYKAKKLMWLSHRNFLCEECNARGDLPHTIN